MQRRNREVISILRNLLIAYVFAFGTQVRTVSSAVSTCGGTLEGRTGTFTSPNYPFPPKTQPNAAAVSTSISSDDEDTVTCEWKIVVPAGFGIQLNFGDFDMAAGLDECGKGELEVFSGTEKRKKSLDKYCGSDDLDTVQLTMNSATVIFRRPQKFSGKGFLVSYIATRPGETIDDFVTCVDRGTDHVGVGSYSVLCPGGCANISDLDVWGSTSYRDNSYLCKAAVHAGVISDRFGGRINVRRLPGQIMYIGSEANGIKTASGAMSDFKIQFQSPDDSCDEKLTFIGNQLTASTYWTTDDDPDKTKWKPDKGILDEQIYAWSPSNPTKEQWLEVDLQDIRVITGLTTKGSTSKYYTSKSYKVAYRNDTTSKWTFYREEGINQEKVFIGNTNIFQESKNNFIKPRIVARFFRIYPTPVESTKERYSLQIGLDGCSADVPAPPELTIKTTTVTTTTTQKTTKHVADTETTRHSTTGGVLIPKILSTAGVNTTTEISKTTNGTIVLGAEPGIVLEDDTTEDGFPPLTEPKKPSDLSENSIIVIAIVAALAVTSILLAALVLILVRKRKKDPKTDGLSTQLPTPHISNNNNTQFHYKSKKSKKRGNHQGAGEHFLNMDYKDTLLAAAQTLQPQSGLMGANMVQSSTLPAEQIRFLGNGLQNGGSPQYMSDSRDDSFISDDDEDHEYQVIPDELVVSDGQTSGRSIHASSSKASTGSSMGNHSRKSDTMQRTWGTAGDAWNKAPIGPNSPMFPVNQRNIHTPNFNPQSSFAYPPNVQNPQITRAGTFPHEFHYSVNSGQISEGAPLPPNHPNLRRGSSQSPSRFQRHSSSSNNSTHSHPTCGVSSYPHDPTNPYYSSVPNGEGGTVTSLNHPGYLLYGDSTIPEQIETNGEEMRKKPSYKVPRNFNGGNEPPTLPIKRDAGRLPQADSEPAISREYNGGPTHSQSMRSDYDRLIRDDSISGPSDSYNKNTFSMLNGSHSQYNQLNLNAAPV